MRFVNKYDIIYSMKSKKFISFLVITATIFIFLSPFGLKVSADYQSHGKIQNTVVLLTFNKEGDNFGEGFEQNLLRAYQTSTHSVRNYLLKQSNGALDLQTQILHGNSSNVIVSSKSENFYKPRYEWNGYKYEEINPEGYNNKYYTSSGKEVSENYKGEKKIHVERIYREQLLISEIVQKLSHVNNYNPDLNGDGEVDSLVIVTDCLSSEENWGALLWPHMGECYDSAVALSQIYYQDDQISYDLNVKVPTLCGAKVSAYNFLSSYGITSKTVGENNQFVSENEKDLPNVGLLTHEILHVVGLSDYYSYTDGQYQSVGEFDVMGTATSLPQNMLGYLRLKLGWLSYEDVLYINQSGTYTLPLSTSTQSKSVAKIVLNDYHETGEYFMAEFRAQSLCSEENAFDGELSGDGLIIYRINPKAGYINYALKGDGRVEYGNMYGEDEVYVYRFGDPKNLKALSLAGQSFALLGGDRNVITPSGTLELYNANSYGNTDKSKTLSNLFTSNKEYSETIIHYSNGENSGIRFSNIEINYQEQTVSFTVELPEEEQKMGERVIDNCHVEFANGKHTLYYQSGVKSGNIKVLALKSTNRLEELAKKGRVNLKQKHFEKGKYSWYQTLFFESIPLAEKELNLSKINEDALIFIGVEDENGAFEYHYAGSVQNFNPTFGQYLGKLVDPIYYIIVPCGCALLVGAVIFIAIQLKKSGEKRIVRK